tara:strand:- start:1185 stop:1442 length:258 start_codon:yes stop_codon:yes gene_type:complete
MNNLNKLKMHISALPLKDIKTLVRQYNFRQNEPHNKIKLSLNKKELIRVLLYCDSDNLIDRINNDNPDDNIIKILKILFSLKIKL